MDFKSRFNGKMSTISKQGMIPLESENYLTHIAPVGQIMKKQIISNCNFSNQNTQLMSCQESPEKRNLEKEKINEAHQKIQNQIVHETQELKFPDTKNFSKKRFTNTKDNILNNRNSNILEQKASNINNHSDRLISNNFEFQHQLDNDLNRKKILPPKALSKELKTDSKLQRKNLGEIALREMKNQMSNNVNRDKSKENEIQKKQELFLKNDYYITSNNEFMQLQSQPHMPESAERNRTIQFTPYTINDYKVIKQNTYNILGGLGPNLGGREWSEKISMKERMMKYADQIKAKNQLSLNNPKKDLFEINEKKSKTQIALEYSKLIPKPKKIQKLEIETNNDNSEIVTLEDKHQKYESQLERLKNLIN